MVYKVCYNEEVTYGEMFDQQNICKADVAILIMRWVALNAECQTKKLCLKKCPNLHQLWLTFYAHYFVFNLCANFGECIIFCTTIFNRRLFLSSEQIRDLSEIFIKHGASLLATPIKQLCNLSISSGRFPNACKIAKLNPLFKKGPKTDPKN